MSDDVRLPPSCVDAEVAVLGALLTRPELYPEVAAIIGADDFYRKHHSVIWKAIAGLYEKGSPVDIMTVSIALNDVDQRNNIVSLQAECYNPSAAPYHARQIRKAARTRRLQKSLAALHERAYDADVDEVLAEAESLVRGMAEPPKAESTSAGDILADVLEDLSFRCEHPGKLFGIPSGYRSLDEITGGFDPGSLIVIGGRTGTGKTTLAVDIIKNLLGHYEQDVAFFSLEMASQDIMTKLLINQAQVSGEVARWGHLDSKDWERLHSAQGELANGGTLHLFDKQCTTVPAIRRHLLSLPKLPSSAWIDHIHIMQGVLGTTDRVKELGEITMDLKNLAKELKIPIIGLAQLNRALESRATKEKAPKMSDLRASGQIDENCDQIIFIHRPELYDEEAPIGRVELIVAKLRQASGSNRLAVLSAKPSYGTFHDSDARGPMLFILKNAHTKPSPPVVSSISAQDIFSVFQAPITPINGARL